MTKSQQRLEAAANILIILVAVLLGTVLVQKYLTGKHTASANEPARLQPVIGSKVDLSGINWTSQPRTLILALQTGCHFCDESAPFYKRLIEEAKARNVKLVAVFSSAIEVSKAHLSELGLTIPDVKQSPLKTLQVGGTPTLILTNDKGEITDCWLGKLLPEKEAEVITKLNS